MHIFGIVYFKGHQMNLLLLETFLAHMGINFSSFAIIPTGSSQFKLNQGGICNFTRVFFSNCNWLSLPHSDSRYASLDKLSPLKEDGRFVLSSRCQFQKVFDGSRI